MITFSLILPASHKFVRSLRYFRSAVLFSALAMSVSAADHSNLEEGLPTHLEDAYPVAYRSREVQAMFSYESTSESEDRLTIEPRLEFGVWRNTQVTLRAPFYAGNADRSGSGDIGLGALYNFNTETLVLPAFALAGEAEFPSGKASSGLDSMLKFIVTKSITSSGLDRIHLNLAWKHNASAESDERSDRFVGVVGYSRRLNADTILVADYVREEEETKEEAANIVELGVRRQLTPLTVLSLGVGAGLGEDSPGVRITAGYQRSF